MVAEIPQDLTFQNLEKMADRMWGCGEGRQPIIQKQIIPGFIGYEGTETSDKPKVLT